MSDIPMFRRMAKRGIGGTGRASERRLTRETEGKGRPASGAMTGAKGDIEIGNVLLEAKSTVNDSMSLKYGWLSKIAAEARSEGKIPALMVSFVTGSGNPVRDGEWVAIPRKIWEANLK